MRFTPVTATAAMVLASASSSCQDQNSQSPPPPSEVVQQAPESPWRTIGSSQQAAVDDESLRARMANAIEQARSTAEQARQKWELATQPQRANWGVKWAAPTADESVEYIWVEPLAWSPFRIEGILANDPGRPLQGGHALGDLVSFPIDQLADWMYLPTGNLNGPREGGFTIEAIEGRN